MKQNQAFEYFKIFSTNFPERFIRVSVSSDGLYTEAEFTSKYILTNDNINNSKIVAKYRRQVLEGMSRGIKPL